MENFLLTNVEYYGFGPVLFNLFLACALSFMISGIYIITYKGYSYSPAFVHTLIVVSMVTSLVIMVIGSNLARAFGLVGAMSIIRFRTALKDTRDIAFVFWTLGTGLAVGANAYEIAILCTMGIGAIVIFLYFANYGYVKDADYLLRVTIIPQEHNEKLYRDIFKKYLRSFDLVNIRTIRIGQLIELTFRVQFKKKQLQSQLIDELNSVEGIERALLYLGEEWNAD